VSDTPETDAEKFFSDHHGYCVVFAEHAEDLERERDKYQEQADALLIQLGATQERMIDAERERNEWKEVAEGSLLGAIKERDEAVSSCQIWQQGHSKIVEDRDYWKAEAERWRATR
jgi:hypothetical protein